jgi:hypothetical protein
VTAAIKQKIKQIKQKKIKQKLITAALASGAARLNGWAINVESYPFRFLAQP